MKIQYCSDLHLEFPQNVEFLKRHPLQAKGDVLLLAGDVVPFSLIHRHEDFFDELSDRFQFTYWIPGNHEYYYSDASERTGTFHEEIRSNVFLVNNISIRHEGIRILFSTLWSKIGPLNERQIEKGMSDFKVITYHRQPLTPFQYNQFHEECVAFLKRELNNPDAAAGTIVVTHHIPTLLNYPQVHKTSPLKEAFAVELFDLIEPSAADYWIYGHHHTNTPDFRVGNTWMLTNQLGYVEYGEYQLFDPGKTIAVGP